MLTLRRREPTALREARSVPTSREHSRDLEKQAALEPKDPELTVNLGEAWLREGRLEEAVLAYARASELDPRSEFRSLYWEWLGLVRESRGELEQALEAYDNWADAEPWSVEPLDRAGTLLVALGRWTDLALLRSQYEQRAEANPGAEVLESMALFSYVMEQLGSTEDPPPLQRTFAALEAESRSIGMRYLLGSLFFRTGHLEAAHAEFLRVLELDSDRTWEERRFSLGWRAATAWLMLGRIARLQGKVQDALQHLQSCLQTSSESLEPLEELSSLLVEQGAYAEALVLLPEDEGLPPWVTRLRARSLLGLGRVEEAARLLEPLPPEKPRRRPSEPVDPKIREAEALLNEGHHREALEAYGSLGNSRRRPPAVRRGMARACAGLHLWKDCVRHLEVLVREQPDDVEAWRLLAEAYLRTGQPIRRRLARIQQESLVPADPTLEGYLAPPGIVVSARSLPGDGKLAVTGLEGAEGAAKIAWTWLRAEGPALGLPDPRTRDLHVHLRTLEPSAEPAAPGPLGDEEETPSEDAGLAILAAMATALEDRQPNGRIILGGRVDLQGHLQGTSTLTPALATLREVGPPWDLLILPRTMAAEIHRLPEDLWTSADVILCAGAAQALHALREEPIP